MVKCVRSIAFCFVSGLLLTLLPFRAAGQEVSIRNNLLYDATGTVNAGLEFQVGDHFSVGVNGGFKSWPRFLAWDNDNVNNTTHWRHFLVAPEGRYYFNEVFKGVFVGADFVYTHFNVGNLKLPLGLYPEVATRREQGSWWGAGLFVGYAWWPWQHWRIEIEGGAGVGLAAYDSYDCDHCGSKLEEVRRAAVVPKLGLNIAYNPVARDKRKSRVRVIEKTDTLTVLQAPVAFVVNLKEVAGPESAGDRLAKQEPWVIPIEKYRPLDYLTRPGKDSIQYVVFPASSAVLERQTGRNAAVLDRLQGAIETIRDDEATDDRGPPGAERQPVRAPCPRRGRLPERAHLREPQVLRDHRQGRGLGLVQRPVGSHSGRGRGPFPGGRVVAAGPGVQRGRPRRA